MTVVMRLRGREMLRPTMKLRTRTPARIKKTRDEQAIGHLFLRLVQLNTCLGMAGLGEFDDLRETGFE